MPTRSSHRASLSHLARLLGASPPLPPLYFPTCLVPSVYPPYLPFPLSPLLHPPLMHTRLTLTLPPFFKRQPQHPKRHLARLRRREPSPRTPRHLPPFRTSLGSLLHVRRRHRARTRARRTCCPLTLGVQGSRCTDKQVGRLVANDARPESHLASSLGRLAPLFATNASSPIDTAHTPVIPFTFLKKK